MDAWFAFVFIITWIKPEAFGERTVHHLTFVMVLEFIVVHASGFMGALSTRGEPGWRRAFSFSLLILLYTIFAAGFSAMYGGWWPLLAFWALMLSRFPAVVLRPPDMDGQFVLMANWAAMVALYVGGAFLTVTVPIPHLGITEAVIEAQRFGIEGLWPEEPYRVMAFGAFYFIGLAVVAVANETISIVLVQRKSSEKVDS